VLGFACTFAIRRYQTFLTISIFIFHYNIWSHYQETEIPIRKNDSQSAKNEEVKHTSPDRKKVHFLFEN